MIVNILNLWYFSKNSVLENGPDLMLLIQRLAETRNRCNCQTSKRTISSQSKLLQIYFSGAIFWLERGSYQLEQKPEHFSKNLFFSQMWH